MIQSEDGRPALAMLLYTIGDTRRRRKEGVGGLHRRGATAEQGGFSCRYPHPQPSHLDQVQNFGRTNTRLCRQGERNKHELHPHELLLLHFPALLRHKALTTKKMGRNRT